MGRISSHTAFLHCPSTFAVTTTDELDDDRRSSKKSLNKKASILEDDDDDYYADGADGSTTVMTTCSSSTTFDSICTATKPVLTNPMNDYFGVEEATDDAMDVDNTVIPTKKLSATTATPPSIPERQPLDVSALGDYGDEYGVDQL